MVKKTLQYVRAFTIVELLVVVVIMGILISITASADKVYLESARVARATTFSVDAEAYLRAKTVNDATIPIGVWNFERVEGGVVADGSGYQQPLSVGTNTLLSNDNHARLIDHKSLHINDSESTATLTQLPADAITVMFWYKNLDGNDHDYILRTDGNWSFGWGGGATAMNSFRVNYPVNWSNSNYVRYPYPSDDTMWHHVLGTYDRATGTAKLFFDGYLQDEQNIGDQSIQLGNNLIIGGDSVNGLIDDLRIFPIYFDLDGFRIQET